MIPPKAIKTFVTLPSNYIFITTMIELKNEQITVKVAELGAELQSVKDNEGREYMWQAGPEWPRHSPILFVL